jgi:hypothetical protein
MHCLEIITRLDSEPQRTPHNLRMHPRIYALRQGIRGMAVQGEYVSRLYAALYKYADQFIGRIHYKLGEGWDDLEALQQVTLGDWMDESIQARLANCGEG